MEKTYTILDKNGLHARPATLLVTACSKSKSDVTMVAKGKEINAKSIMGVMGLAVAYQESFTIKSDDEEVFAQIDDILTKNNMI